MRVFGRLPEGRRVPEMERSQRWERGFRTPGCLTSKDEERETWTAESLRISERLKASAFRVSGSDERLRRYTFQRLHHRCPRCESQAAVGFGWQKMVGPRQTL